MYVHITMIATNAAPLLGEGNVPLWPECNTFLHTTATAIIASPTVKDTVIMVKFKYTCIAGAFTLNHIFQYSPCTIVNFHFKLH